MLEKTWHCTWLPYKYAVVYMTSYWHDVQGHWSTAICSKVLDSSSYSSWTKLGDLQFTNRQYNVLCTLSCILGHRDLQSSRRIRPDGQCSTKQLILGSYFAIILAAPEGEKRFIQLQRPFSHTVVNLKSICWKIAFQCLPLSAKHFTNTNPAGEDFSVKCLQYSVSPRDM